MGTYVSLAGTNLSTTEKLFSVVAYIPKATVQAAIGAMPLAAGVDGGEVILAVAVLSILITAPLGAIGIKLMGEQVLAEGARPAYRFKDLRQSLSPSPGGGKGARPGKRRAMEGDRGTRAVAGRRKGSAGNAGHCPAFVESSRERQPGNRTHPHPGLHPPGTEFRAGLGDYLRLT